MLARILSAAAATIVMTLAAAGPASADGGTIGGNLAGWSGTGVPTTNITGTNIIGSGYSLAQVDPISQTMSMGALGTSLSDDSSVVAELADADAMAIDTAELARAARLAEEARRAQLAAGRTATGLKAGAVPAKYENLVLSAVADYCPQLEPAILAAQIEAESGWNPRAVSAAGAQGIAQFMPGTWANSGVDANGDGTKDVWDPADAIPSAAKYDCAIRDAVRKVPGDLDANMLAGYNAGPGAVLDNGGIPPYSETRAYVDRILSRADEMIDYSGGAGSAGTSAGCPTTAPAGTLRDQAAGMSILKICSDSVAQAPTPEAARAIKFALRNLGAPYSQANRMSAHMFDCSSFVSRSYEAAGADVIDGGWAPTTATIPSAPWAQHISFEDRLPGDLVFPFPGHVTMSLADGLKVHTNMPGDVSHVNDMYSSAYLTVRVVPSKA